MLPFSLLMKELTTPAPITPQRARQLVSSFAGRRILVLGDVMLDRFLWGTVSRISPEAPVPVVEVASETAFPGGAANVARNLRELGAETFVAGSVGEDAAGETLLQLLQAAGIETSLTVKEPGLMTTVKTRVIAQHQQVVRVDRERRSSISENAIRTLHEKTLDVAGSLDAAIIEDYAKGFVTQQNADALGRMASGRFPLAIDPNPRNPIRWTGADVIKPNKKEALEAAGLAEINSPKAWIMAGQQLLSLWETQSLLLTLGEEGMALFEKEENKLWLSPTKAREVYDVSGAGDTAVAVFALARACGANRVEAMELANHASGIVVAKLGTATLTPRELIASFETGALQ